VRSCVLPNYLLNFSLREVLRVPLLEINAHFGERQTQCDQSSGQITDLLVGCRKAINDIGKEEVKLLSFIIHGQSLSELILVVKG